MSERAAARRAFLEAAGWGGARAEALAGDASSRRYIRLHHPAHGETAVLMDAPPGPAPPVAHFARIARYLRAQGFSAPAILATDAVHGFLLTEDLGCGLLSRHLDADPGTAGPLCAAAVDMLAALAARPAPRFLPRPGPAVLTEAVAPLFEWYCPAGEGKPDADAILTPLHEALAATAPARPVLALRDCHAGNLIWLPARMGPARLGLLDFQDAFAGHPAYDLVSLLDDARRDLPPGLEAAMIARHLAATGAAPGPFRAAYAALGAQRALRILGIFARLARRDGKTAYLAYLPRVWAGLWRALAHPGLAGLARAVEAELPPPAPDLIARLAAPCRTAPTP